MLGYLKADDPGQIQPVEGGWYDTGDIAAFDANGFLTIKGRAKRFAKIAGEMVSLAAIDALANALWPEALSAATALPDTRRGERIVLVTQQAGATRADFAAFAREQGAAELLVPAEIVHAAAIPVLGSGKIDFAGLQRLIEEQGQKKDVAA
jgi:acyl-[acyl-carrier-protein]-phospholipid O-acyltransferase/long-chain-fatty-acid--[acyl-carrier-protein] ligase